MRVRVSAPNRIDLAGGTTDIYPLYLLMSGGCAVNAAVDVSSVVELVPHETSDIHIHSKDLGESLRVESRDDLPEEGPLALVCRAIRAFPPPAGVSVRTKNEAPAGSGLGASSALLIALLTGLERLRGERSDPPALVDAAANIETSVIGVPAGKQDYLAAVYGGANVLEFGVLGVARQAVRFDAETRRRFEEMVILSYTGAGRFSGMNNWRVTKAFIDGEPRVRRNLTLIRDIARETGAAMLQGRLDLIPELVNREWEARTTLAPGVTTDRIDEIMRAARRAGALGGKVCGAGGGGCMITLTSPRNRTAVERAVEESGGRVIHAGPTEKGVQVEEAPNPANLPVG